MNTGKQMRPIRAIGLAGLLAVIGLSAGGCASSEYAPIDEKNGTAALARPSSCEMTPKSSSDIPSPPNSSGILAPRKPIALSSRHNGSSHSAALSIILRK